MHELPDNPIWRAFAGDQARFTVGDDRVRRYAPGFSPIVAFADPAKPDFGALAALCAPGEAFYCAEWGGTPPPGWRIEAETTMLRMVWDGALPAADDTLPARALGPADADAALALATLTRPGPFGPRTIELGDYLGVFDDDGGLVAMAGERMQLQPWREISGVCTAPAQQGRGLARRLMLALVRRELARGERPFLHVMRANATAHGLYGRMGFGVRAEVVVRVVVRG